MSLAISIMTGLRRAVILRKSIRKRVGLIPKERKSVYSVTNYYGASCPGTAGHLDNV
jgi:hypothetical protein